MPTKTKKAAKKKPVTTKSAQNQIEPSPACSSPNHNFRANPERSIYVTGEINAELIRRLTPEICRLRHSGPTEPITVYIDSEGGRVDSCEHLEGLLFNKDQDGKTCRIITVVTALAASAAARLLSRGDCVLAYSSATIHCHGTRISVSNLTRERAESASRSLMMFNDQMANTFMHKTLENLPWLYQFYDDEIESRHNTPSINTPKNIQGLAKLIQHKLSFNNRHLMESVFDELTLWANTEVFMRQSGRKNSLDKAKKKGRGAYEFRLLKLLVDFLDSRCNKFDRENGLDYSIVTQLADLYSLRKNYYDRFFADCDNPEAQLMMYCSKEQLTRLQSLPSAEQKDFLLKEVGDRLFAAWQIATTLSSNLVRGENSLTATDAYWLGLVEEVIGDDTLLCRRALMERNV